MVRLFFTVALVWFTVTGYAQDSLQMYNIIDVDVVKPNTLESGVAAIPGQINKLESDKEQICDKIRTYKSNFKTFKRSEIFQSSTGYYKPTIILGLKEIQVMTNHFSDRVDLQIDYVLSTNLDYKITSQYIRQLQKMQREVHGEYNSVTTLYRQRITSNY